MNICNYELVISKDELIDMIQNDNTDKNDWSKNNLTKMITSYKYLSKKQYEWVLSKIKYIVNHNGKYKNIRRKFRSFEIEENIIEP